MPVSQTLLLQFVISFMDVGDNDRFRDFKKLSASALQRRGSSRSGQDTAIGRGGRCAH